MEDDERAMDGRRAGASVWKGEAGELFHEGDFPELFSFFSEGDTSSVGGLEVDVAGFQINDRGSDAVAIVDNI